MYVCECVYVCVSVCVCVCTCMWCMFVWGAYAGTAVYKIADIVAFLCLQYILAYGNNIPLYCKQHYLQGDWSHFSSL